MGYDQLSRMLTTQFATLSLVDRLEWLNNLRFIMTPEVRTLVDKIARIQEFVSLGQARNLLLGGKSGTGKTTFLNWLMACLGLFREEGFNYVPVTVSQA